MIGLFDSGVGELTVVRELIRKYPGADFVYLGDTARYPYGNKSKETVERYAVEDAKFVIDQGAELVIVACNTASSLAMDKLRATYPDTPFLGVIKPAAALAVTQSKTSVGVVGTRATVGSGIYDEVIKELNPKLKVLQKACPLFVPLVEEGMIDDQVTKMMVRRYLMPLRQKNVETLILGCTHYPFLQPLIERFMGKRVKVINSAEAVVDKAYELYPGLFKESKDSKQTISFTDASSHLDSLASKWLGKKFVGTAVSL
ncbi:MAG: glutamate racemase [Patescibacteria group bacterium]|nr:glutamate racemase [Patescibacteria group bacterium]